MITSLVVICILAAMVGCSSDEKGKASNTQSFDATCGDAASDGGASCGDSNSNGDSVDGSSKDCDDQNQCTIDSVDTETGACVHANVPDATTCDDGNACTTLETCQVPATGKASQCVKGIEAGDCNDNNPCTTDTCDPKDGTCKHSNNDSTCDDGDICTSGDMCKGGACIPGKLLDCDDKKPCTIDTCDGKMGGCQHEKVSCDDKNPCTTDSCDMTSGACQYVNNAETCQGSDKCFMAKCQGGACVAGTVAIDCDDANQCTLDSCVPATGCKHAVQVGATCNDSDVATQDDKCEADGVCAGAKPVSSCDDNNACTIDSGDKAMGIPCVNTPVNCDDQNGCTKDDCDVATGCVHFSTLGQCEDGDACTIGEKCSNGKCAGGAVPDCDDNNGCTSDTCDPAKGCVHSAMTGVACEDGDVCTSNDKCGASGICVSGPVMKCDDLNPCTTDSCDTTKGGCQNIGVSGPACNDGKTGTINDVCVVGVCQGNSIACDDGNKCTFDSGNGPPPNCTNVQIIVCDDKNLCTTDSCDPTTGKCVFLPNSVTVACDDGDLCTIGDVCTAGNCVSGPATKCDDGDPCTKDACDKTTGKCGSVATPGCGIGEICGNGIDDDNDGKTDCSDSECGATADAPPLLVNAQYGGEVTVLKYNGQLKTTIVTSGVNWKFPFTCGELPAAVKVTSTFVYNGPEPDKFTDLVSAWLEGPGVTTAEKIKASGALGMHFGVANPAPPNAPTLAAKVNVASTNLFQTTKLGQAFMVIRQP